MKKNLPGKFSMLIRSTIFSILMIVFTAIYGVLCVLTYPFPLSFRCKFVYCWTEGIIWILKYTCCIDYEVEGAENLPRDRNAIVMSKHQSAWETFYLPGKFRETAIILKKELYWVPFFGWGMAMTDPIGIDRKDKTSAMKQIIRRGSEVLKQGRWVLIFPEGTRINYGEVGKYRLGGARLAVDAGVPIIPVAHNAGLFWAKRKFIKRPGTVHLIYGPPIETQGRTAEEVMALTQDWIETKMQELYATYK
jgi:1-acyl-sn-glycerol-3-phosphate acyltransferase